MIVHRNNATALPGFRMGAVSVQDTAAQLAAPLLDVWADHYVLDACAAPGGKAAHLLEISPTARLVAVDNDPGRLVNVSSTLERLGLQARVMSGDATDPSAFWDSHLFDRVLVDAPCSGTGVIRRIPWGRDTGAGRQILPGEDGMDGFFYALLRKAEGV